MDSAFVVNGVPRHHEMIGVYGLLIRETPEPAVLLELRAGTGWYDGHWHLPAGHVDAGESVVAALARELGEELSIGAEPADLELLHTMHCRTPGTSYAWVDVYFGLRVWSGEPRNAEPHRCAEIRWWPLDAVPANTAAPAAQALSAIRHGEPFSLWGWQA
ncbi:MAG: 8-oxo-dGTP diphosphatase [Streptomyces sp.]|nr:8-oxo-dGTP diphosphatase [Streptomyces sp.]